MGVFLGKGPIPSFLWWFKEVVRANRSRAIGRKKKGHETKGNLRVTTGNQGIVQRKKQIVRDWLW